jgi:hypothetical protein
MALLVGFEEVMGGWGDGKWKFSKKEFLKDFFQNYNSINKEGLKYYCFEEK